MYASLDGTLSLTKRDRQILEQAPLLAAMIALHRPQVDESAKQMAAACPKILQAADGPKTCGEHPSVDKVATHV